MDGAFHPISRLILDALAFSIRRIPPRYTVAPTLKRLEESLFKH